MKQLLSEQLIYKILSVVEEIPAGKIASDGRLDMKRFQRSVE